MELRKIASIFQPDFLAKGGAGSGNYGHAGRPGERGGSAPSSEADPGDMFSPAGGISPKGVMEDIRNLETKSKDAAFMAKLQKTHGLKVETIGPVGPEVLVAVHETLAILPKGLREHMKDQGVKVKLIDKATEAPPTFELNGQTLTEGGHADSLKKELVLYSSPDQVYGQISKVVAHEAGHFGVHGLLGTEAAEKDLTTQLYEHQDELDKQIFALPIDSPDREVLKEQRRSLIAQRRQHEELGHAIFAFQSATKEEGGWTKYADDYIKDPVKSTWLDSAVYQGPVRSQFYRDRAAASSISRYANENFAEIMGQMYSHAGGFKSQTLKELKRVKPKTYAAFKQLHSVLGKKLPVRAEQIVP